MDSPLFILICSSDDGMSGSPNKGLLRNCTGSLVHVASILVFSTFRLICVGSHAFKNTAFSVSQPCSERYLIIPSEKAPPILCETKLNLSTLGVIPFVSAP